jgi:hypothetical protein
VAYWFSDKIVLAMYRAKPVSEAQAPELHRRDDDSRRRPSDQATFRLRP